MIDKVQKIKEWISKTQDGLMDTNGNFEYPEHEGAYHILCNLDTFIDSLQEKPVSEDFTKALAECIHKAQCSVVDPLAHAEVWKEELVKLVKCEEPVSEDLGEYTDKLSKQFPEVSFAKLSRIAVRVAKWQKEKMMAKAIDAHCFGFQGDALFSFKLPADKYLVGSKVKVIVIK